MGIAAVSVIVSGYIIYKNFSMLKTVSIIMETLKKPVSAENKVTQNQKNITVNFQMNGKLCTIIVPYDKTRRVKDSGRRINIIYDDHTEELYFPCGVAVNFTPEEVGACRIDVIENYD